MSEWSGKANHQYEEKGKENGLCEEEWEGRTAKILHKQLAKNAILSHITFVWPTFITVYACLREENIPD